MSGTASIGSLVSDHAPDTAAANVSSSTSQRFRTDEARMRSIIARSILGQRFQQLGLEQKRIGYGDHLATAEPGHHLHNAVIALAENHLTLLKALRHANENDCCGAHVLNGTHRDHQRDRLLLEGNCGGNERTRSPDAALI